MPLMRISSPKKEPKNISPSSRGQQRPTSVSPSKRADIKQVIAHTTKDRSPVESQRRAIVPQISPHSTREGNGSWAQDYAARPKSSGKPKSPIKGSDNADYQYPKSRGHGKSSSSNASYSTGESTEDSVVSDGEEKSTARKKQDRPADLKEQEMTLRKALEKATREAMKKNEMIKRIVEEEGYSSGSNSKQVMSFPNRAQLAELAERGYTLSEKIGSGCYANVYVANYTDPITRRKLDLACKLCDRTAVPKDVVRKFLSREIEILTTLNHPYVIQLHSILQQNNKLYMFMRYAENGDLLEWIRSRGVLKEQHARVWFRQMVMGLNYLHYKDIVHRDLKCENILLTKRNNVKIADFGFARFCVENGKRVLSTTFCGSAAYAAPEVVSASPYNPKMADVWSLGVILFIMLNGTMPFDDTSLPKLLNAQLQKKWSFRRSLRKVISHEGKLLVTNILEPDTIRRMYLDKIQKTNFFLMPEEVKAFKSFKNYSAEYLKNLSRLYVGTKPRKEKDSYSGEPTSYTYEPNSQKCVYPGESYQANT